MSDRNSILENTPKDLPRRRILVFCAKHSLSPSVKAGGYGIAGWAIAGDVIIDMSKLVGVDIEPPRPGGGYTSLRDIVPGNKEAGLSETHISTNGKRRREDDDQLRIYNAASGLVTGFLQGPLLPAENLDVPSLSVRRRLDAGSNAMATSAESSSSATMSNMDSLQFQSSIPPTSPSREQAFSDEKSPSTSADSSGVIPAGPALSFSGTDPFGYMNLGPSTEYRPVSSSRSIYRSYGPTIGASFPNTGSMPSLPYQFTRATPIHQHVYVTFGAGMRQKEIDKYTAEHPIEATSSSGFSGVIPYHVPL